MTAPYPLPLTRWHCRACGVEWDHGRELPCWLCGSPACAGGDPVVPWTANAHYVPAKAEQELAS